MRLVAQLAPPNSLVLVLDPGFGSLPETMDGRSIAATSTGLAIGTLSEFDGETEIRMTDGSDPPPDEFDMRWSGSLGTSGRLAVVTIDHAVVLETDTAMSAQVQLWTNDETEPDVVWLVVQGSA